ncbi:MAG: IPExxxVDY family protein [Bacteroidales bacterium]|nr:IPExxxVDY family protein [Bacteroidales bacterium]
MKKKSHKLDYNNDFDFGLIGIVTAENDYRCSWIINQNLKTNFMRSDNLVVLGNKNSEKQEFSLYTFEDEEKILKLVLIANRCENGYLLPELKNIDFLLQIYGEMPENYISSIISDLRNTPSINAVFLLEPGKLKSAGRLSLF